MIVIGWRVHIEWGYIWQQNSDRIRKREINILLKYYKRVIRCDISNIELKWYDGLITIDN